MAKSKLKLIAQIEYNLLYDLSLCSGFVCDDCPVSNSRGGCVFGLKKWYRTQVKINQWKKLNK
jgi:hypothetical protein